VSQTAYGVSGDSNKSAGVRGTSVEGRGTEGWSTNAEGIVGISKNGNGVWGQADKATGVLGTSQSGVGVWGRSETNEGIHAETNSLQTAALAAISLNVGSGHAAILGEHRGNNAGVLGRSLNGAGVWGFSQNGEAVHGETHSPQTAAIAALNLNPNAQGAAIFAHKAGSAGHAGVFEGRVAIAGELTVTGDIILPNADCAEDFDIAATATVEPGTVMVIGEDGALRESESAYDSRVAGVVSGAGSYRPALVLDRQQPVASRQPVALLGKVFCKADAALGAIVAGDLLTTSPTPGHAMKVVDRERALGAVIGKALGALADGRGLIPVLVALR
jgi:hypothetical protein